MNQREKLDLLLRATVRLVRDARALAKEHGVEHGNPPTPGWLGLQLSLEAAEWAMDCAMKQSREKAGE